MRVLMRYTGSIREFRLALEATRPAARDRALDNELGLRHMRRELARAEQRSRRAVDKPPAA